MVVFVEYALLLNVYNNYLVTHVFTRNLFSVYTAQQRKQSLVWFSLACGLVSGLLLLYMKTKAQLMNTSIQYMYIIQSIAMLSK